MNNDSKRIFSLCMLNTEMKNEMDISENLMKKLSLLDVKEQENEKTLVTSNLREDNVAQGQGIDKELFLEMSGHSCEGYIVVPRAMEDAT